MSYVQNRVCDPTLITQFGYLHGARGLRPEWAAKEG